MSNHSEQGGGNGFFNGLLLGFLVGGGAVFLFGTKKGKKLLKIITEEGLEGISELEEFIEDEVAYEEEPVARQKVTSSSSSQRKPTIVEEDALQPTGNLQEELSLNHKARRLFKGIRRR